MPTPFDFLQFAQTPGNWLIVMALAALVVITLKFLAQHAEPATDTAPEDADEQPLWDQDRIDTVPIHLINRSPARAHTHSARYVAACPSSRSVFVGRAHVDLTGAHLETVLARPALVPPHEQIGGTR